MGAPLIRLDEPGRRVDVGERHRQRFLFIARDQTKPLEVLWTKSKRPRIETSGIALRGLLLPAGIQNVAPGSSLSGRPFPTCGRFQPRGNAGGGVAIKSSVVPVSRRDAGVNDRAKMRLGSGHVPHQMLLVCEGNRVRLGGRATEIQIALVERAGEVVTNQGPFALAWPRRLLSYPQ